MIKLDQIEYVKYLYKVEGESLRGIAITSNLEFSQWNTIFEDNRLAKLVGQPLKMAVVGV